ncbi:HupA family protein [Thermotoga profunda]|uniref:transferrin-binding protein-like solute binding protein n=1 Tax=Thermotoga profunda TaxID=1508420 RepID=UPI001185376B|nr:transferrin-binding protein-like solute binding protein [Thermotoga profunda]
MVNVAEFQRQGVLSPELPSLPTTILKDWGYTLPQQTTGQQTQPSGTSTGTIVNLSGNFSGTYRNSATGQQGTIEFNIQQSANRLQGEVYIDDSDYGEFTGTISGNTVKITATVMSTYYQTQYVLTYSQSPKGDGIL